MRVNRQQHESEWNHEMKPEDIAKRMAALWNRYRIKIPSGGYRVGRYSYAGRRMSKTTYKPW